MLLRELFLFKVVSVYQRSNINKRVQIVFCLCCVMSLKAIYLSFYCFNMFGIVRMLLNYSFPLLKFMRFSKFFHLILMLPTFCILRFEFHIISHSILQKLLEIYLSIYDSFFFKIVTMRK